MRKEIATVTHIQNDIIDRSLPERTSRLMANYEDWRREMYSKTQNPKYIANLTLGVKERAGLLDEYKRYMHYDEQSFNDISFDEWETPEEREQIRLCEEKREQYEQELLQLMNHYGVSPHDLSAILTGYIDMNYRTLERLESDPVTGEVVPNLSLDGIRPDTYHLYGFSEKTTQ